MPPVLHTNLQLLELTTMDILVMSSLHYRIGQFQVEDFIMKMKRFGGLLVQQDK